MLQQLIYVWMVLVIILIVAVYYLYTQDTLTDSNISAIQSKLSALTGNVDDIATVTQLTNTVSSLSSTVQTLQTNPVKGVSSTISPQVNDSISAVSSANAVSLAFNETYTLTHYTVTVTPATQPSTAYVDIPLVVTVTQGLVISNRGISNAVTSPSISNNIINDVRTAISSDGTFARVFFTVNSMTDHQLSITILSK